jgi:hypothetical protein
MPTNGFCSACLPSITTYLNLLHRRHPQYANAEQINRFFRDNVNSFLVSIGEVFQAHPRTHEAVAEFRENFRDIMSQPYFNRCEVVIDSGGFQIQNGYLPKSEFHTFVPAYYQFVREHVGDLVWAFHLDLAPGAHKCVFRTEAEMLSWNLESYQRAAKLPRAVRQRMFYIHHFRTPAIRRVWNTLLESGLADRFDSFATGGMASRSSSARRTPCVPYSIPFVDIIAYVKEKRPDLKRFRFHVLGAAQFTDILIHRMFERHVAETHNVLVNITFDSSKFFTEVIGHQSARSTFAVTGPEILTRLDLHEVGLDRRFRQFPTRRDAFYYHVNEVIRHWGMARLDPGREPIYRNGELSSLAVSYAMFHFFSLYRVVNSWSEQAVMRLYPLYQMGRKRSFLKATRTFLSNLNDENETAGIQLRAEQLWNSLDLITRLDTDAGDQIVDTRYRGDEHPNFRPPRRRDIMSSRTTFPVSPTSRRVLTVEQAKALVGNLSQTTKMPCASWSIGNYNCQRGKVLRAQPGTVCSQCYAGKGFYPFSRVVIPELARYRVMYDPLFVSAMTALCKQLKWFRWFDSGDLPRYEDLLNIVEICKRTPTCSFWLSTREIEMVAEYLGTGNTFPDNLTVRISKDFIDTTDLEIPFPGTVIAIVSRLQRPDAFNCPATGDTDRRKCGYCRACWNKDIPVVNYLLH